MREEEKEREWLSSLTYCRTIFLFLPVPEEEEVLYPPLTYLRPISVQCISNKKGQTEGKVVLVKPSFPS